MTKEVKENIIIDVPPFNHQSRLCKLHAAAFSLQKWALVVKGLTINTAIFVFVCSTGQWR